MVLTLARGLLQILYPNLCWICRKPVPPERPALCPPCAEALFSDPRPTCPCCAATVGPFANAENGCAACKDRGFAFDRALRLGSYEEPLRGVILRIKDAQSEGLAEVVATEWAASVVEKLRPLTIDYIVPVPLHWWRRWQRGYNQSDALGRALSKVLHLPLQSNALRRIRKTATQAGLSATQRRENVRGAFLARASVALAGKSILLVDDVMTTGSTAHEAARALRNAGAAKVIVAVLARAEA